MTRRVIWAKDDYFERKFTPDDGSAESYTKIQMDPNVVKLPDDDIPISIGFNHDVPPIGKMTDVRLADGSITGEVFWFDPEEGKGYDELLESGELVFGGYYGKVVQTTGDVKDERVMSCELRGASMVPAGEIRSRPQPKI